MLTTAVNGSLLPPVHDGQDVTSDVSHLETPQVMTAIDDVVSVVNVTTGRTPAGTESQLRATPVTNLAISPNTTLDIRGVARKGVPLMTSLLR